MAKNSKKAEKAAPVAAPATNAAKTEAPKAEAPAVMVVASAKATKPNTFFAQVQAAAQKPITLAALITNLQTAHKTADGKALVPKSKKEHDMVIRVRTNYALNHGFLQQVAAK